MLRRPRQPSNPLEQIIGNAARSQQRQDDDSKKTVIRFEGTEYTIGEKRRELILMPDPHNPGAVIPRIESVTIYDMDPNGRLPVNPTDVGGCRFGHIATSESLFTCSCCRRRVCHVDALQVGDYSFCRKGKCLFFGRLYQSFRILYRVVRFFFLSATGLYTTVDEVTHTYTNEEEFFDVEYEDLTEMERR